MVETNLSNSKIKHLLEVFSRKKFLLFNEKGGLLYGDSRSNPYNHYNNLHVRYRNKGLLKGGLIFSPLSLFVIKIISLMNTKGGIMWEAIAQMTGIIFLWLAIYLIPIITIMVGLGVLIAIIKKL